MWKPPAVNPETFTGVGAWTALGPELCRFLPRRCRWAFHKRTGLGLTFRSSCPWQVCLLVGAVCSVLGIDGEEGTEKNCSVLTDSKSQLSPREKSGFWNGYPGWGVVARVKVLIRSQILGEVRFLSFCSPFCLGSPGWTWSLLPAWRRLWLLNGADMLWGIVALPPGTGDDWVWRRWPCPLFPPSRQMQ